MYTFWFCKTKLMFFIELNARKTKTYIYLKNTPFLGKKYELINEVALIHLRGVYTGCPTKYATKVKLNNFKEKSYFSKILFA